MKKQILVKKNKTKYVYNLLLKIAINMKKKLNLYKLCLRDIFLLKEWKFILKESEKEDNSINILKIFYKIEHNDFKITLQKYYYIMTEKLILMPY